MYSNTHVGVHGMRVWCYRNRLKLSTLGSKLSFDAVLVPTVEECWIICVTERDHNCIHQWNPLCLCVMQTWHQFSRQRGEVMSTWEAPRCILLPVLCINVRDFNFSPPVECVEVYAVANDQTASSMDRIFANPRAFCSASSTNFMRCGIKRCALCNPRPATVTDILFPRFIIASTRIPTRIISAMSTHRAISRSGTVYCNGMDSIPLSH